MIGRRGLDPLAPFTSGVIDLDVTFRVTSSSKVSNLHLILIYMYIHIESKLN